MKERILKKTGIRTQALAALLAVAAAVVIPQICHLAGQAAGVGNGLGTTLLPMHLAVLAVGLLAGPWAGLAAGALSPVVSFALTGMPAAVMLPSMTVELAVYGLVTGLLRGTKVPVVGQVLAAQIAGRLVKAGFLALMVYGFGQTAVPVASVWTATVQGLLGILLQLALIPLFVYRVRSADRD